MDKNKTIHRLCKWFLLLVFVITFFFTGKQKTEKENFWTVGKEVALQGFLTGMMYHHSVLWGLMQEMETCFWTAESKLMVESVWEFPKENAYINTGEEMLSLVLEENAKKEKGESRNEVFYLSEEIPFLPNTQKQVSYDYSKYQNVEELMKQFYTVDSTAGIKQELFDVNSMRNYDCGVNFDTKGPQILLYHTHGSEAFVNSRNGEEEDTIIGAGEILASYLEEYGFSVYHHKEIYDENRDYAYSEALPEIEQILQENPDIQVVLDLHRDAVAEETKLVTSLQGHQIAKVMFFNGLSCSAATGDISYLQNPYIKENLAFSFQMKAACDEYYPGFARNIYLRAYRYNMHLCPKTLLIELGAQTNTVEEIRGALAPLAHVLSMVLE